MEPFRATTLPPPPPLLLLLLLLLLRLPLLRPLLPHPPTPRTIQIGCTHPNKCFTTP